MHRRKPQWRVGVIGLFALLHLPGWGWVFAGPIAPQEPTTASLLSDEAPVAVEQGAELESELAVVESAPLTLERDLDQLQVVSDGSEAVYPEAQTPVVDVPLPTAELDATDERLLRVPVQLRSKDVTVVSQSSAERQMVAEFIEDELFDTPEPTPWSTYGWYAVIVLLPVLALGLLVIWQRRAMRTTRPRWMSE